LSHGGGGKGQNQDAARENPFHEYLLNIVEIKV
jgi:hypothetical protein